MKLLIGLLFLALSFPLHSQEKHKVVFQVSDNDPAKWNLALNNARNVQAGVTHLMKRQKEGWAYIRP